MRSEARSMTPADMMALAAGVGLGIVLRPPLPRGFVHPALVASSWTTVAAVAVSLVVLTRSVRFRRGARPAEWLAILAAIYLVTDRPEWQVDAAINLVLGRFMRADVSFSRLRWAMAGLASLAILAGLGVLRAERRTLPPWLKTMILAWLAFLALWGPIEVIGLHGPDLLAPSQGFGRGPGPALAWIGCRLLARVPLGLLFGIPLIAAIDGRVRRIRWAWTEWSAFAVFLVAWLLAATLRRTLVPAPSLLAAAEKGLDGAWVVGVGLLSRWALVRFGPTWRRWFEAPDLDQGLAATSIEASPASTP